MFRILGLSDLHGIVPNVPAFHRENYDTVILAGDVTNGTKVKGRIDAFFQKLAFLGEFYFLPGNDDNPVLVEMALTNPNARSLHRRVAAVGEYEFIGVGGATTGLVNYFAFSDHDYEQNMRDAFSQSRVVPNRQILVTHDPPINTALDFNLRKDHVGAPSVRRVIEEQQPLLALCGHIHEARGFEKIGQTTCVNCGAVKLGSGAEISIEGDQVSVKFLDFGR